MRIDSFVCAAPAAERRRCRRQVCWRKRHPRCLSRRRSSRGAATHRRRLPRHPPRRCGRAPAASWAFARGRAARRLQRSRAATRAGSASSWRRRRRRPRGHTSGCCSSALRKCAQCGQARRCGGAPLVWCSGTVLRGTSVGARTQKILEISSFQLSASQRNLVTPCTRTHASFEGAGLGSPRQVPLARPRCALLRVAARCCAGL